MSYFLYASKNITVTEILLIGHEDFFLCNCPRVNT